MPRRDLSYPCPQGHNDWFPSGKCRPCTVRARDATRATPRGKLKEAIYRRRHYLKHAAAEVALARQWQANHPEQDRKNRRRYEESRRGVNYWVKQAAESF